MEIAGKVAIVTGAGSGIGRATALRLAREGARVVASDVNGENGEAVVRAIKDAGGEAVFVRADVSRDAELQQVFAAARESYGGLDILFNNAGIATGLPAWPETPPEKWERTLAIDLWAVIRGTQLAIPMMRERRGGVIVNTASMAGISGIPMDPVYGAAKGGVVLFTRSLAPLKAQANITVCCVCPGVVDTAILQAAEDPNVKALLNFPALPPEEIADAVVSLIGDESAAGKALSVTATSGRSFVEVVAPRL